MRLFVSLGILVSISSTAVAQGDSCGCYAVLADGVYNYRAERGDQSASNYVRQMIANSNYDEFKRSVSAGGGASFFDFGFNANMSRGEYEARKTAFRQEMQGGGVSATSRDVLERYGDANVLSAWGSCMSSCNTQGLHSWASVVDSNTVILHIKWIPTPSTQPRVENSHLVNGTVVGSNSDGSALLPAGFNIPTGETIRVIRRSNVNQPVIATAEITGMDIAQFIPKYIPTISEGEQTPVANDRQECLDGDASACASHSDTLLLACPPNPGNNATPAQLNAYLSCRRQVQCWQNMTISSFAVEAACSAYGAESHQCSEAKTRSTMTAAQCDQAGSSRAF